MTGIRVRSTFNLQPLIDELDRIEHLPNERVTESLDHTLGRAFETTQAFVHILSGRLKASGDVRSFTHGHTYEGVIRYGGADAYWAPWEFSRDGHDPFADDPAFHTVEGRFEDAINDAVRDV